MVVSVKSCQNHIVWAPVVFCLGETGCGWEGGHAAEADARGGGGQVPAAETGGETPEGETRAQKGSWQGTHLN